ncbi:MAG TPA: phosphoesterase [Candidatus Binatia bacterium]|nr:phosphoesterase [Candidatus Binatia bacterium]
MRIKVFYHDKCFDGACSAALFTRFYRERIRAHAQFEYQGLVHRAGALFNEADFTGDENAIVDFKYSSSPRITWWFDHHQSAFLTPEDASHFEQAQSNTKFYDPDFRSCTKFIAVVAEQCFGFDSAPLAEMIEWADIIDGALYDGPEAAVEMKSPASRLTMLIETTQDPQFIPALIARLARTPLHQLVDDPAIAALIPPLLERHRQSIEIMRQRSRCQDGTIFFDVTDHDLEGYNKFIPYYLHPHCLYSVGLSKSSFRTKVSVGSNPWASATYFENLAKICERYGGGGHARVGAISFPPNRFEEARQAADEIVAELRASYRAHQPD